MEIVMPPFYVAPHVRWPQAQGYSKQVGWFDLPAQVRSYPSLSPLPPPKGYSLSSTSTVDPVRSPRSALSQLEATPTVSPANSTSSHTFLTIGSLGLPARRISSVSRSLSFSGVTPSAASVGHVVAGGASSQSNRNSLVVSQASRPHLTSLPPQSFPLSAPPSLRPGAKHQEVRPLLLPKARNESHSAQVVANGNVDIGFSRPNFTSYESDTTTHPSSDDTIVLSPRLLPTGSEGKIVEVAREHERHRPRVMFPDAFEEKNESASSESVPDGTMIISEVDDAAGLVSERAECSANDSCDTWLVKGSGVVFEVQGEKPTLFKGVVEDLRHQTPLHEEAEGVPVLLWTDEPIPRTVRGRTIGLNAAGCHIIQLSGSGGSRLLVEVACSDVSSHGLGGKHEMKPKWSPSGVSCRRLSPRRSVVLEEMERILAFPEFKPVLTSRVSSLPSSAHPSVAPQSGMDPSAQPSRSSLGRTVTPDDAAIGSTVTFFLEGRHEPFVGTLRAVNWDDTFVVDLACGARLSGIRAVTLCSEDLLEKGKATKAFRHNKTAEELKVYSELRPYIAEGMKPFGAVFDLNKHLCRQRGNASPSSPRSPRSSATPRQDRLVEPGHPCKFLLQGDPTILYGHVSSLDKDGRYTINLAGGGKKVGVERVVPSTEDDVLKAAQSRDRFRVHRYCPWETDEDLRLVPTYVGGSQSCSSSKRQQIAVGACVKIPLERSIEEAYGVVRSVHDDGFSLVDLTSGGRKLVKVLDRCSRKEVDYHMDLQKRQHLDTSEPPALFSHPGSLAVSPDEACVAGGSRSRPRSTSPEMHRRGSRSRPRSTSPEMHRRGGGDRGLPTSGRQPKLNGIAITRLSSPRKIGA